jgi:PPK2 family polyphosphate:nucleotide phosphotransferase
VAKKSLERLRVRPGDTVRLADHDPSDALGWDRDAADLRLDKNRTRMAELHDLLYADNNHALLIVLQGMDTCGKDGTVRHVLTGLDPQGCKVHPFKVPSSTEADHDYLWRVHQAVPARGEIGVFNRSHYEDVLVTRVQGTVGKKLAARRFQQINDWERHLTENDVLILKLFLHISRDEQRERLQARLDDPSKNWKFSEHDLEARARWDDYQDAYADLLMACSTDHAPWYIVPANRKWVRNLVVSELIVETLASLKMTYPRPKLDRSKVVIPK